MMTIPFLSCTITSLISYTMGLLIHLRINIVSDLMPQSSGDISDCSANSIDVSEKF